MRLSAINLHPVKSTAIRPVERARVGPAGLVGDREWMVVDGSGDLVSARELPSLFHVVADTPATGGPADVDLRLAAPRIAGAGTIDVAAPDDGDRGVSMFGNPLKVRAAGAEADAWLRRALGRDDLHLVWCADPAARELSRKLAPTLGDQATFQDVSPVSLASTTSMARLNSWMKDELPVSRFRANLVVDGADAAFVEDRWSRVRIGEVVLRVASPIDRCVMTTIDPVTVERGKDPIRTLARHRRWDGKTWFAVHLMIEQGGEVAVGDQVVVP